MELLRAGNKFGNRIVVDPLTTKRIQRQLCVLVKCKCGKEHFVQYKALRSGNANSCVSCSKLIEGREGNVSSAVWSQIKGRAKTKNIELTVSKQFLITLFKTQKGRCALTGRPLTFAIDKCGKWIPGTASLDRIDSNNGYTEGNVRWVHMDANMAKQSLTDNEFIQLCSEIISYSRGN